MHSRHGRFTALDGVRGLAILLVLVYHVFDLLPRPKLPLDRFAFGLTTCGWIGVDLFFVLSGFLITGILARSKHGPGYFRNFYARRSLRILPLYYGFLFVLILSSRWHLLTMGELDNLREHQWWYWLHATNWLVASKGSYAVVSAGYLWSLAVEEQFYLVWPFVVLVLSRLQLGSLCVALFLLSSVVRFAAVHFWGFPATSVYAMTFTHLEPLVAGSGLAILSDQQKSSRLFNIGIRASAFLSATALAAMFYSRGSFYFWDRAQCIPSTTLLALLFVCLIHVSVLPPRSKLSALMQIFLRNRLLTSFGKFSYAIYLIHVPVAYLVTNTIGRHLIGDREQSHLLVPSILLLAITTAAVWVLGGISYHCFEKHVLSLKKYFEYSSPETCNDVRDTKSLNRIHSMK